jgi:4-amino-4-deoxy-L-arabinose transferase-like glycosyltransferase
VSDGLRVRGVDLGALLFAYAALALAFGRAVPLLEAPDEQSHLHYAAFLAWEGRLPATHPAVDVPGEGMQPPLYYAWLAPWLAALAPPDPTLLDDLQRTSLFTYWQKDRRSLIGVTRIEVRKRNEVQRFRVAPEVSRLRALRLASLPFGLLAVGLTYAAVLRASRSRALALLAASLLAFTPQFAFVSAYVNNDVAAAAIGAAALWIFVRCADRRSLRRRDYVAVALLFALGAATKYSSLPVLAVTCAALPCVDARPPRARLVDAGIAGALLAALLLGLAGLNIARFGEPTGTEAVFASAAELGAPEHYGGLFSYLTGRYAAWTFQSYWAYFGWMNIPAPFPVYIAFFTLLWTGLLGFTLGIWRSAPTPEADPVPLAWLRRYVVAAVLGTWLTHLWLNTQTAAAQGRHLYAAAPHVACMLALGIAWLATGHPLRVGRGVAGAVAAGMAALALYCLLALVAPAYAL